MGCEAIVHSVASLMEDPNVSPDDRCILLVDFSNVFHSVNREYMFSEVRALIPAMASWLECCYGSQLPFHLGNHTILSCCGVQQGNPLGCLGCALALHPIIENFERTVSGVLINTWYLDDGTLRGSASNLHTALEIIEAEGPLRGLSLSRGISLLYAPADTSLSNNAVPPGIPVTNGGFNLLGSPVGPTSHCIICTTES